MTDSVWQVKPDFKISLLSRLSLSHPSPFQSPKVISPRLKPMSHMFHVFLWEQMGDPWEGGISQFYWYQTFLGFYCRIFDFQWWLLPTCGLNVDLPHSLIQRESKSWSGSFPPRHQAHPCGNVWAHGHERQPGGQRGALYGIDWDAGTSGSFGVTPPHCCSPGPGRRAKCPRSIT